MDEFWAEIALQIKALRGAANAEDVIRTLAADSCVGDAFFAGSGGDDSVYEALSDAGWEPVWIETDYYYCLKAPDGSMITYVEGDIYRGNRR